MLKRLYVDNFRCLVDFDYQPQAVQLLIGQNGSGKSSVFDVLDSLAHFARRPSAGCALFPSRTLCKWDGRATQTFQLDVELGDFVAHYALELEHLVEPGLAQVTTERLADDEGTLFQVVGGKLALGSEQRAEFLVGQSQSAIWHDKASACPRIRLFREWLQATTVLRLNPYAEADKAVSADEFLQRDGSNFAGWYRRLQDAHRQVLEPLASDLAEVIDGFAGLNSFKPEARYIIQSLVRCGGENAKGLPFGWSELSEGQRTLIVIYAVMHAAKAGKPFLLCLDEPDNFVALREMQPLVHMIEEFVDEGHIQVLIASHHPEFINMWGHEQSALLYRQDAGHTELKTFPPRDTGMLSPAEIIARGWEND